MTQKIAIIIPTYNRKVLLIDTVRSCLNQKKSSQFQIIICIVDDGSTDGTDVCVAENFHQESSIFYHKITNSERGAARNRGADFVRKLNPDWLLFLDSDDIIIENAFLNIEKYFSGNYDLITSQFLLWDGINTYGQPMPKLPHQKKIITDQVSLFLDSSFICICTTLIRSSVFYQSEGFSENRLISGSEDWYYFIKMIQNKKIGFTGKLFLYYRRYDGNTVASQTEKAIQQIQSELFPYWQKILSKEKFILYIKKCKTLHDFMIVGAYNNEFNFKMSYKKMKEILRQQPSLIFSSKFIKTSLIILSKWLYFLKKS